MKKIEREVVVFPFESLTSDCTGAARARWVGRAPDPGPHAGGLRAEGLDRICPIE